MNITEHEMRGLLTGKCLPGDMLVNEGLPAYLVRKFAELKAQRNALAVECAALKESVDHAAGCIHAAEVEGLQDALESRDGERLSDLVHRRLCHAYLPAETPATDDYLNSVRADAVVEASAYLADMADGKSPSTSELIKACGRTVFAYGEKLRAGEQS